MEASAAPVNPEDASPPPAAGGTGNPPETPQGDDPGQNLSAENNPPDAEGANAPGDGDPQTVLSQTGDAELDSALAGLTPAMRKHVVTVSKLLGDGAISSGEVPRIGALLHERHELSQTVTQLKGELEAAKAAPAAVPESASASPLPANVAALKTVGEVIARKNTVSQIIRQASNALLKFPNGHAQDANGEPVWKFGKAEFNRADLADEITGLQEELEVLPERAQQLHQTAQLDQQRRQLQTQTRKQFPWLADPENVRSKAVAKVLEDMPSLKGTVNPEYWAAVVYEGRKVLDAELAARQNGGNANGSNGSGHAAGQPPKGKVPTGKPHSPSPATPPTPSDAMKRFNAALPKAGERVTAGKLEDVLAALPR